MTDPDYRQPQRYTFSNIHWGYPLMALVMVPILLFLTVAIGTDPEVTWGRGPMFARIGYGVAFALTAWASLAVLHTTLRTSGQLSDSVWDWCFLVRKRGLRVATLVWIVGSAVIVVLAGWFMVEGTSPVSALLAGLTAGLLVLPWWLQNRSTTLTTVTGIVVAAAQLRSLPLASHTDAYLGQLFVAGAIVWIPVASAAMLLTILRVTRDLDRARRDSARLAVAEERVRFSRDLHDVFGRTLSAVALKAELAAAQSERRRPEAADTMREVQGLATAALAEVRGVVRGYRDIDLTTEVAGARSLLESAGVEVSVVMVDVSHIPAPVLRSFAWTVREATTNILRHSDSRVVSIQLSHDAHATTLTIANDGSPSRAVATGGSGILGLRERLADIGGTLVANRNGDWFILSASVDKESVDDLTAAGKETA